MNEKLVDFCSYIQPILNSCLGFIKTEGYFTHVPGLILAMSGDETVFAVIKIPVIYDVYVTSIIGRFLQLKTPEEQSNLFNEVYFTGWNIKQATLIRYNETYTALQNTACIFEEPDCYMINDFSELSSNTSIGRVNVSDGVSSYMVPASKSITALNKADTVSLRLYHCAFNPADIRIRTARYTMFKKKFKLNVDIFTNILNI